MNSRSSDCVNEQMSSSVVVVAVLSLRSQRTHPSREKRVEPHSPEDTGLWDSRHSPQATGAHPSPTVLSGALRLHCQREELAMEVGVP